MRNACRKASETLLLRSGGDDLANLCWKKCYVCSMHVQMQCAPWRRFSQQFPLTLSHQRSRHTSVESNQVSWDRLDISTTSSHDWGTMRKLLPKMLHRQNNAVLDPFSPRLKTLKEVLRAHREWRAVTHIGATGWDIARGSHSVRFFYSLHLTLCWTQHQENMGLKPRVHFGLESKDTS